MQEQRNGFCACGCGRETSLVDRNATGLGLVKGERRRYLKGHQPQPAPDLTRFRVDGITGCWVWQGALNKNGYGAARFGGRCVAAHRAVWLDKGHTIPDGAHLHHKCHNRACVNPDHLEPLERVEHSTMHARANGVLSPADARAIRQRAEHGHESASAIGRDYGVSGSAITAILRNERWREEDTAPLGDRGIGRKLDTEAKASIRARVAAGESQRALARELGISQSRISTVVSGKSYKVARVFNLALKGETRCRNCGASGRLHLHHAVPRSMCRAARGDLRNGITLCADCHNGWHHRLTTVYRDLFTEEEWAFISSLELLGQNIAAWLDDRYPPRPERNTP